MSGLIVGYGNSEQKEIDAMLKTIEHRGAYISGIYKDNGVIMAQNYLRADSAPAHGDLEVPVTGLPETEFRICYDGQMGNWEELARTRKISDGPFREERLLLHLYHHCGHEMLSFLDDTIFAFVISNGEDLFAARDLLGIKTLFYGRKDQTLYLSSELKSIVQVTDDVHEFPPGHYMDNPVLVFFSYYIMSIYANMRRKSF